MKLTSYKSILSVLLWYVRNLLTLVAAVAICPAVVFCAEELPGFETQDITGSTLNYSGTVGVSAINIPTSANKVISEVLFKCPYQTPLTIRCQISFDGTTYFDLMPGEFIGWSTKGFMKQFKVKANQAGVSYQAIVNYENW
jgi:hypothetical protein